MTDWNKALLEGAQNAIDGGDGLGGPDVFKLAMLIGGGGVASPVGWAGLIWTGYDFIQGVRHSLDEQEATEVGGAQHVGSIDDVEGPGATPGGARRARTIA